MHVIFALGSVHSGLFSVGHGIQGWGARRQHLFSKVRFLTMIRMPCDFDYDLLQTIHHMHAFPSSHSSVGSRVTCSRVPRCFPAVIFWHMVFCCLSLSAVTATVETNLLVI